MALSLCILDALQKSMKTEIQQIQVHVKRLENVL